MREGSLERYFICISYMTFSGLPFHLGYIRGKCSEQCDGYSIALRQQQLFLTRKTVYFALPIPSFPFLPPSLGAGRLSEARVWHPKELSRGWEHSEPSFSLHRAPRRTPKSFLSSAASPQILILAPLTRLRRTPKKG